MAETDTKMTEEDLIAQFDSEFEQAMGAPGGDISTERAKALRYYMGEPFGDEEEGQSSVVSADVADVVDGVMPSLLRIFTTADNLVGFDPVGPEDEEQAAQESDYVNYVFFKQNPAFEILYAWFFDALVQKNGIVKAWADESEDISQESYKGLTEDELLKLLDDDELEPLERSEPREEQITAADGVTKITAMVQDVTFRRVTKKCRLRVAPVPPEEYRISSDACSLDPSSARFVGQEREVTRSELLAMGFDKTLVDDLPARSDGKTNNEQASRNSKSDERTLPKTDRSQDKILVRDGYLRVDFDGDGRSELRHIISANGVKLENEVADRQGFHILSPKPLPHKHFGQALAEKVMDIQEVNSHLERQVLDNLYHTNRPGHAVWEQGIGENTLDDLLTTRVGRIARFSRPVGESYQSMTVPFTAAASFPMIEFFDKAKRDRTGVSADSQGLTPDALKNIQTSVLAQAYDIGRMKIEVIARIFAETGIKSLFLHLHELAQKHPDRARVVRLRNQWVKVDPTQWRTRTDMTVNIGLGIGTREQNLLHLNAIKDLQTAIAQNGGMNLIVTPKNIWHTASEYVKNANLKSPEMFFTDPGDAKAPPPSDQQMQLQKQQQDLQQRQQQLDGERQQLKSGQLLLQAERQKFDAEKSGQEIRIKWDEQARRWERDRQDFMVAVENVSNQVAQIQAAMASTAAKAAANAAPQEPADNE